MKQKSPPVVVFHFSNWQATARLQMEHQTNQQLDPQFFINQTLTYSSNFSLNKYSSPRFEGYCC